MPHSTTFTNRDGHSVFSVGRGGTRLSEPRVQLFSVTVQFTGYQSGKTTRTTAHFTKEELAAIHADIGKFLT